MIPEVVSSNGWRAIFHSKVFRDGELIHDSGDHHNLRTNDGIDWQSGVMGGGPASATAQLFGTATATSASSLTNTGAAFPVTGGYGNSTTSPLAGKMVVCGSGATAVYGVIISNTATVLTIDRWNLISNPGGAAGATPSGTSTYVILGAAPLWWMTLTSTVITPAATDHTLSGELSSNGFVRTVGAWSHTNGTATYSLAVTYTCTGGSTTINGEALFNCQNLGIMGFEATEPSPPTLISGDTLAETVSVSY